MGGWGNYPLLTDGGYGFMAEALIRIHIEPLEEGGYLATSDDVPGLLAQGRTVSETIEIAQDVCRKIYESYLAHGDSPPPKLKKAFEGELDTVIAVSV